MLAVKGMAVPPPSYIQLYDLTSNSNTAINYSRVQAKFLNLSEMTSNFPFKFLLMELQITI